MMESLREHYTGLGRGERLKRWVFRLLKTFSVGADVTFYGRKCSKRGPEKPGSPMV